ncbi:MAG TPA: hypothetical protein VJ890_15720, partial [Vineibacter sp.]|nr:hypothetical protein [Vineibacter sp.]
RRALEAQGYEARKLILATRQDVPADCSVVISASPRTAFLTAESTALRRYLEGGGSALFLFDLGFAPGPELERLMADLGARFEPHIVIDPLSHYRGDAETVAVTGYDPHPITRRTSMTLYPGVRPLSMVGPPAGLRVVTLLASSRDSYTRPVQPAGNRATAHPAAKAEAAGPPVAGPRVLGIAAEGLIAGGTRPLRVVAIGDGDFASNSYFPYMANSDLLLSTVRWLVREDRGTAVAARIPVPSLVLLTDLQARVVFGLVVVLLPLAVVALGAFVWWRRR